MQNSNLRPTSRPDSQDAESTSEASATEGAWKREKASKAHSPSQRVFQHRLRDLYVHCKLEQAEIVGEADELQRYYEETIANLHIELSICAEKREEAVSKAKLLQRANELLRENLKEQDHVLKGVEERMQMLQEEMLMEKELLLMHLQKELDMTHALELNTMEERHLLDLNSYAVENAQLKQQLVHLDVKAKYNSLPKNASLADISRLQIESRCAIQDPQHSLIVKIPRLEAQLKHRDFIITQLREKLRLNETFIQDMETVVLKKPHIFGDKMFFKTALVNATASSAAEKIVQQLAFLLGVTNYRERPMDLLEKCTQVMLLAEDKAKNQHHAKLKRTRTTSNSPSEASPQTNNSFQGTLARASTVQPNELTRSFATLSGKNPQTESLLKIQELRTSESHKNSYSLVKVGSALRSGSGKITEPVSAFTAGAETILYTKKLVRNRTVFLRSCILPENEGFLIVVYDATKSSTHVLKLPRSQRVAGLGDTDLQHCSDRSRRVHEVLLDRVDIEMPNSGLHKRRGSLSAEATKLMAETYVLRDFRGEVLVRAERSDTSTAASQPWRPSSQGQDGFNTSDGDLFQSIIEEIGLVGKKQDRENSSPRSSSSSGGSTPANTESEDTSENESEDMSSLLDDKSSGCETLASEIAEVTESAKDRYRIYEKVLTRDGVPYGVTVDVLKKINGEVKESLNLERKGAMASADWRIEFQRLTRSNANEEELKNENFSMAISATARIRRHLCFSEGFHMNTRSEKAIAAFLVDSIAVEHKGDNATPMQLSWKQTIFVHSTLSQERGPQRSRT